MTVHVTIDQSRIQRLLSGPAGIGNRLLSRKAERVAALARVYARGHGSIPEGIFVGPVVDKSVTITSLNPHSLLVHNGSRRHKIVPRSKQYLRFRVGGRVVFARAVSHPGYKGDPFLTRALRDAG